MAHINKNLLEAFRDAGGSTAPTTTGTPGAKENEAGGPFASPEPLPSIDGVGAPPLIMLLVAVGLFALGFVIGRMSMTATQAAEPGELAAESQDGPLQPWFAREGSDASRAPASSGAPGGTTPGAQPGGAATPARDRIPLEDPANRFTAIAIQYDATAENRQRATETSDYLRAQGFPTAVAYEHKRVVFVFVGASPSLSEVQRVVKNLHATAGPRGEHPFSTAYAVNIDDYISRGD